MKLKFTAVAVLMAWSLASNAAISPNDPCQQVLDAAKNAKNAEIEAIKEERRNAAKAAQEAQSCLARAGDSILRAAIPPSLSSILGVLTDPEGYLRNATTNAACNIITNEANKVARGLSDVNGAVLKAGRDAQKAFTDKVDGAMGNNSRGGYYPNNTSKEDQGFYKSMSCRLFGRC